MKYGLLNQRSPLYLAREWAELNDLYAGGYTIAKSARRYLPKYLNESPSRYEERVKSASYVNYVGMICDFFASNLFSQELRVQPASDATRPDTLGAVPMPDDFYEVFSSDADRCGNSFAKVMRMAFLMAILKGKALIAIDFPSQAEIGVQPVNRKEEEDIGADRGYVYEIPAEEMIDWEMKTDKEDEFSWCILKRIVSRRASVSVDRDLVYEEFKVWEVDEGDGTETPVVKCTLYKTPPHKPTERYDDDLEVAGTDVPVSGFKRIPIIEMEIPIGLWVGNKIGPIAKEHFQRRSALVSAENKSLMAVPWVKLGPEVSAPGDAMPSEAQQDPNRGRDPINQFKSKGWMIMGKDDNIGFAEPAGSSYELTQKELEKLIDEMFRIVHQMAHSVSNTKSGMYRSAASKMQDRFTTEIILSAYGSYVKDASKKVYNTIAEARGESVVWNAVGLDKYDLEDRTTLIQEATALSVLELPSKTFRKEYLFRLGNSLLGNVPPETQAVIKKELEDAVDAEGELRDVASLNMVTPQPGQDGSIPTGNAGSGSGGKKVPKRGPGGRMMGSVSVGGS